MDWTRGVAVVAMVLWHSGDAWLQPGLKAGEGFAVLRFFGGLAAPSFLLLAGLAAALGARAARDAEDANRQFRAAFGRGLEVLIIGYMLRLQGWLIDAAAIRLLGTMRAWVPIALGYLGLYVAARTLRDAPSRSAVRAAAGLALVVVGMVQVEDVAQGRLARLLQVDVLQAIGASLMILAIGERAFRAYARPAWLLLAGVVVALCTLPVWSVVPGGLPVPLAAYFGRMPAAPGAPLPTLFPLFPWFSYACVGAGLGRLWLAAGTRRDQWVLGCAVGGAALAVLTGESHAYVQRLMSDAPICVQPLRVAFRVGMVTSLLGLGFAYPYGPVARVLCDLGRASLRVYWAHLLFAYGLLGIPLRGSLGYAGWASVAFVLLVAMWGLSRARLPRMSPGAIVRA